MTDKTFAFSLPDTLPDDPAALEELRTQAIEAYEAATPAEGEVPTPEQLEELKGIVDALDKIDAALQSAEAEHATRTQEHAALNERVYGNQEEAAAAPAEEATGEFAAEAETPAAEAPAEAEKEKPAVTASTFAGSGRAARRRPADAAPNTKRTIGYALDGQVPDWQAGPVDSLAVAARIARMNSGSRTAGARVGATFAVATLDRDIPAELIATDEVTLEAAMARATDETNLPGNSLVAAGGWCAPSETVYDFLGVPTAGDLLDMPEISVARGGIKFPVEPDFSSIYSGFPGFAQTEAQAIAGDTKECHEIPCGDFDEVRLGVIGLCITAGILQSKAWPELIKRYVDGIMVGHQHRISARSINDIVAGSTAVTIPAANVLGAAGAILNSVELGAEDIRTRHRLPSGTTIEGFAPTWVRPLIRADLAYRSGMAFEAVTDAVITEHFAIRGVRLQFVSDWQTDAAGMPGAATPITAWPTSVKIAMYPAGTWFRSVQNVIELGVTYDKASLQVNKRTELFTEDSIGVGKRGVDSRVYTVPVSVAGYEGLRVDLGGPAPVGP